MKWKLYNFLFAIAYTVMLPSFLLRMKRRGGYRERMGDRFGKYPEEILSRLQSSNSYIWIHAVSVIHIVSPIFIDTVRNFLFLVGHLQVINETHVLGDAHFLLLCS